MSKKIVIGVVVLLVVAGGVFIANSRSNTSEVSKRAIMEKTESESGSSQNQKLDNNSKYVEYSKEAFKRASTSRRVLYFYASWCPTCRPADDDFRTNLNKFPEDLVLIRVNYNDPDTDQEEKELAKKYAVTYQHTFVQIDAAGAEVKKWNGGQTEELLANIK